MKFAPSKAWLRYAAAGLLAATGCRACSDCYDYSSPVADPVYGTTHGRAGSNLSGGVAGASWQPATVPEDSGALFTPPAEYDGAEAALPADYEDSASYEDEAAPSLPSGESAPPISPATVLAPAPAIASEPLP